MEYFFSNQYTDDTEFDSVDADLSGDVPITADDEIDDDYAGEEDLLDELSDNYPDDDEATQFTLSTLLASNVDDMERDDYVEDSSEDTFTGTSFEPDLPQLASSYFAPIVPVTGRDMNVLATDDNDNSVLSLPVVILGAALVLTALVALAQRRGKPANKKGNKDSYNIASSPSIKRDLGV